MSEGQRRIFVSLHVKNSLRRVYVKTEPVWDIHLAKTLKSAIRITLNFCASSRRLDGVKRVFIRSGIRYDYLMYDKDETFFKELIKYHISGQLKVAPEHIDDHVLEMMGKPGGELYQRFVRRYKQLNDALGMNQYIVPYFMSSHPGSTLNSAIALAEYLKASGQRPEQVQDFIPLPALFPPACSIRDLTREL